MKKCIGGNSCQNPLGKNISCEEFVKNNLGSLCDRLNDFYLEKCKEHGLEKIDGETLIKGVTAQEYFREDIFNIIYSCTMLCNMNSDNINQKEILEKYLK